MRTGPSGTIEVVGLAPGQYTMTYMAPDEAQRNMALSVNAQNSGQGSPQQVPAVKVTVTLPESSAELRNQKRFLQLVNQKTSETFNASIPDKGDVEFGKGVPPGVYELSIGNSGNIYIQSITGVGAKVSGRAIEIKGNSDVKLNASFAQGKGEITGIVTSHEKPFGGAMVLLVPTDPGHNIILFRRDQSNTDGSFALHEAIPGKYTIVAIERGWELEWQNPEVLKPYIAGGTSMEVKPGGKYEVKVTLQ